MARGEVRARMAAGAARLLAQRGLEGTSFAEVLALTQAPRGSTYHHFPGGKTELVHAALDVAAQHAVDAMESVRGQAPVAVIGRFLGLWQALLDATGLTSGCAVLAVTVAADSTDLLEHTAGVFRRWIEHLTALLVDGGLDPGRAHVLATTTIAATEGAVAISRAQRSRDPFDAVATFLLAAAAAEVAEAFTEGPTSP